jgi:3-hydroxy-9,10-secoandrosta-1,3,5(10)-triene-9,17-dione monooxygenase
LKPTKVTDEQPFLAHWAVRRLGTGRGLGNQPGRPRGRLITPSATAEAVDGGDRVSGWWALASGCAHAQWSLVGVPLAQPDGQPEDALVLIPADELTIQDTWFAAGMRATASNTVVGEDVFVPTHRCLSLAEAIEGDYPTPLRDEPLYRGACVPTLALFLAGPQLGLAQAALDLVIEKAPKCAIIHTNYHSRVGVPTVRLSVARAAALVDSAELHAFRAAAEIDEAAHHGSTRDYVSGEPFPRPPTLRSRQP